MIIDNLVTVINFILNSLKQKGLICELKNEVSFRNLLRLFSWLSNRFAFIGPHTVLVDITNKCGLGCVMCMFHSPFVGAGRGNIQEAILPLNIYSRLISDLKTLRVNKVFISGQGEPLLHPDIEEIVHITRKAKIEIFINTGGSCLSKERIKTLLDYGLSGFDLSMHAADAKTYKLIHAGAKDELFEELKGNLFYLSKLRKEANQKFRLTIFNVISRLNYGNVTEMIEFASSVDADRVIFKPVMAFQEIREKFSLREPEIMEIKRRLTGVKPAITNNIPEFIHYLDLLLKVKIQPDREKTLCHKICHIPWTKANVCINGDVIGCLYGALLYGERKILGNIYRDSFVKIYKSQEYSHYRQKHLCPEICYGKVVYHLVI